MAGLPVHYQHLGWVAFVYTVESNRFCPKPRL
jgi:hypothetical protein